MQRSGRNRSPSTPTHSSESGSSLSTPSPPPKAPNNFPFLRFVEQPMPRQRLRYESEGLGSIKGAQWTLDNKTKPEVEIVNYIGPVMLIISCVTANEPFTPHPNQLTSRATVCFKCNQRVRDRNADCPKGGGRCKLTGNCSNYFYLNLLHSDSLREALNGVGLQSVKRNDVQSSIENQCHHGLDLFNWHKNHPNGAGPNYDLKKFRLRFQAFINYNNQVNYPLEPLVSNVISATELKVKYICKYAASVDGGTEMVILGADLPKDLQVRFFEVDNKTDDEVWSVLVKPEDVYRSVAVRLMIPAYHSQQLRPNANVYISLFRPSEQEESSRFKFEYIPNAVNKREEKAEMIKSFIAQQVGTQREEQQKQEQQQQQTDDVLDWNIPDELPELEQQTQLDTNQSISDSVLMASLLDIIEQYNGQ